MAGTVAALAAVLFVQHQHAFRSAEAAFPVVGQGDVDRILVALPGAGVFQRSAVMSHQGANLFVGGGPRGLAVLAQPARQALRQDRQQRIAEGERFQPHVEQTRDAFGGAVRMQGREHQRAGQRGFDRDARGLVIAHFADHHHVRVGAQEGAQRHREGQVLRGVDRYLRQCVLGDFNRVFGGPDLGAGRIEVVQQRMQGGGLAGAGRPAHQEQAARLGDRGTQCSEVVLGKSQIFQSRRFVARQDAHHHVFVTAGGGNGRDAQFDRAARRRGKGELAVLRHTPLVGLHLAQVLDLVHQPRVMFDRHLAVQAQGAILANPHPRQAEARPGLDVDVGATVAPGVDDQA